MPHSAFDAMATMYRGMGATVTRGRSPLPYLQGRAVGGTSVVNGAICWRLPRDIYEAWCATDPMLQEALPWESVLAAHRLVEQTHHVHPTAADVAGPNNHLMARGAESMGIEHRPIRRNVNDCIGRARCLQGCTGGASMRVDRTFLPDAGRHGAEILAGVGVEGILHHGDVDHGAEGVARAGGRVTVLPREAAVVAA